MTESARPTEHDYDPALTACPLCGGKSLCAYHRDGKGRRIELCCTCGVQLMNPQYTDAYLADYYGRYQTAHREDEAAHRWQHETNLDLLAAHGVAAPGRLLDFGCGRGHLLRVARERGWQGTGYDVDPESVGRVARAHDLDLLAGDFLALDLRPASFDLVTMNHVLEHLKDPAPVLRRIHELLRPGGALLIAVPNIEGLSNRLKLALERMGLRRKGLGAYYDADHHLFYYTPDTLQGFVERVGLRVVHRQSAPKVRPGEASWRRELRRRTTDRLLQRSSFLVICRKP